MLTDRMSGGQREVDVVAEGTVAGHNVVISIEVRDHARPQGLEWIEQAHDKHSRLPTNLLVLVSSSGFTNRPWIRRRPTESRPSHHRR